MNRAALHHCKQVHGIAIVAATAATAPDAAARVEADGIYTRTPGETVAVKTADCLPLLFAADGADGLPLCMAVHAGWRGFVAGIADAAVDRAVRLGVRASTLRVLVGPAIGPAAFEVGDEVIDALAAGSAALTRGQLLACITKGLAGRWHVDLQAAAVFVLANHGVPAAHIKVVRSCTRDARAADGSPLWHSARREGAGFGSNWSCVTAP